MTPAKLRRHVIPILIGIGLVAFTLVFQLSDDPLVENLRNRMEWIAYDLRLKATLPDNPAPPENIIIIDIDDKSINQEGRWPWPRAKMADLVTKLSEAGVAVIVFDIVFSEPEANVAISVLDILEQYEVDAVVNETLISLADVIDGDIAFATAMQEKEIVMGYSFLDEEVEYGVIGVPLTVTNLDELDNSTVVEKTGYLSNIEILQGISPFGGAFTAKPDPDGVIRRSPLVFKYKGEVYPSLSLEAVRKFFASEIITVTTAPIADLDVVESIDIDGDLISVPTDGEGSVLVPYRGPAYSFTYIPATDVLQGTADPSKLESTIAFIGASATGLLDLVSTPVSNILPGVEVHATIAAGIMDVANSSGESTDTAIKLTFPEEPEFAQGLNFVITLVFGLLLAIILPYMSPVKSMLLFLLSGGGVLAFNFWLWTEYNFVVAVASPFIMIVILSLSNLAYGYLFESQGKKALSEQFGQYVPPALVDQMLETEEDLGFEGDRRVMTVLFADIRSFTTISESLSASGLKDMLNRFFTPMTEIIFNTQGTIDKYVGDMIMAFWGAPLHDDDHAKHAINGALLMLAKVEEMKPEMDALGYPEINLGVGLNTGEMNVGNMGSEFRRAYTVLGDNVNLGSRLEGLTKFYGVKLIVGERTREGQDSFLFRRLDKVQVKGKTEPVIIFEPVCRIEEADEAMIEAVERFEQALDLYYDRKWDEARAMLEQLHEEDPDRLVYSLYLDRMKGMNLLLLTEEWDGTFEHTSK